MNAQLDDLFGTLADPTRRAILSQLRQGEASAGELAKPFALSQPAVSRHLARLQTSGLVSQRRQGTRRLFRLTPHRLLDIDTWLDDFRAVMEANYARLDTLLSEKDQTDDH